MTSEAAARLTVYADRLDAYRTGRSEEIPGGPSVEDVRAILAERAAQATEIAALRKTVAAARAFIEPLWVATLSRIVPAWRTLKPFVEALDESTEPAK